MLRAAVAAGHPATVRAGIEILEAGGTAADAAVAACLASCVAETVMTGLLGGGHAIYHDAGSDSPQELTVAELRRLIEEAGRVPVERDTLYREVLREEGAWRSGRTLSLVT